MKYRPTPLNLLGGLAIGFGIWFAVNPGPEGWGILLLIPAMVVGLISFVIDYFFQKYSGKYIRTFLIELGIIAMVVLTYLVLIKGTQK